jgi:hypothetical protein
MKSKKPKKRGPSASLNGRVNEEGWAHGVKPGEMKEIAKNLWVVNTMVVLDPPEPIKKRAEPKPRKKTA